MQLSEIISIFAPITATSQRACPHVMYIIKYKMVKEIEEMKKECLSRVKKMDLNVGDEIIVDEYQVIYKYK